MAGVLAGAGFALLFASGELLVRGSVALARRLGVSQLLVGLVVVGFATSAPELVVCLDAAFKGSPQIATGNIVGSTVANLLLILGAAAAIAPVAARDESGWAEAGAMCIAVALFLVAAVMGGVSRLAGLLSVLLLAAYLGWSYEVARRRRCAECLADEFEESGLLTTGRSVAYVVAGLAGLVAGGQLLVTNAAVLARILGVSEAVIGLTLVAVGTSLPELATTVVASVRGHGELAIGNVLGSNLFNVLGIVGATAIVRPLPIAASLMPDAVIALVASVVLLPVLAGKARLQRWAGFALLASYTAYVVTRFL